MSSSIREQLIKAGIIIPASKRVSSPPASGHSNVASQTKNKKSTFKKVIKNENQNRIVSKTLTVSDAKKIIKRLHSDKNKLENPLYGQAYITITGTNNILTYDQAKDVVSNWHLLESRIYEAEYSIAILVMTGVWIPPQVRNGNHKSASNNKNQASTVKKSSNKKSNTNKSNESTEEMDYYFFAQACAKSVIYNDISDLKVFLSTKINIKKYPMVFAAIKREKRTCGTTYLIKDNVKSLKILQSYNLKNNDKASYNKLFSIIHPEKANINKCLYKEYKSLNNQKFKHIDEQLICPVSLGKCRCKPIESKVSVSESLEAIRQNLITDKVIKDYIDKNPAPVKINKFGEPQAKYRNGTYGLHGMEYNHWNK